jgi:hypothetical protein
MMRRIRVEKRVRRAAEDRNPVLPLDPRDPDVLRAKRAAPLRAETRGSGSVGGVR